MESETINLSAQENSEIELSEKKLKYSGLIKECLASNPGQAFIEVNEFGSLVESEVEPNTRRKFSRYENAYISRLIEEATYLEEVPKKVEGYYSFIAQVPFYLYGIDSIRERSAGLMLYDKAKVVINTNNEEGLYISIDGVPEHEGANWAGAKALRGEFVSANYVNEYFYIPKIEQSEDPLETLKQFEADKEKRNSFIASARDMMKGFAKRYNELFATELALTEKIEGIRKAVEGFPPQTLMKEIQLVVPQELRSLIHPFRNMTLDDALKEVAKQSIEMDAHRYDVHRAMEYFGYKFGGGMNKQEVDRTILIDRCPERLTSRGGKEVGIVKNPPKTVYIFANEYDYDYEYGSEHGRTSDQDRELITTICKEINTEFGQDVAVFSDRQGGSTHTYWREVSMVINNLGNLDADGSEIDTKIERINNIIQKHIDAADTVN